jgi:serine/threonine protein kinase
MENTSIDKRYRLVAPIGAGGEARVFRAHDSTTNTDVALRLAPGSTQMVFTHAVPAHHDRWVKFLDSGSDPQYGFYQTFELLEGRTLRQVIQSAPLEVGDWRFLVDQSLDAVEVLHDAGWVHGDLNADNLFHTDSGWKLLELPFVRLAPQARRSALFGSIYTLAPEQIDGAIATVASDIYALGCLYYFAASGAYPHPGASSTEVAIHCLRFPPDPLDNKARDLSPIMTDWVMHLLQRDAVARPATIAAARHLLRVA